MSHMQWKDEYSVNISVIDEQHKKIVDALNALFDANETGKAREVVGKIIQDIVDYAGYHFATEETFMKNYGFPGLEAHRAEHDAFRKKAAQFEIDFKKNKPTLTLELGTFLTNWLDHHILTVDKQYGPFLNEKGVC